MILIGILLMMHKRWPVFGGKVKKKNVSIYRTLSTGTIEEKIFQRQITKIALSNSVVESNADNAPDFSPKDLKDIFNLREDTACDTHDMLGCRCSKSKKILPRHQREKMKIDELAKYEHYDDVSLIDDPFLQKASNGIVTFVFAIRKGGEKDEEPQVIGVEAGDGTILSTMIDERSSNTTTDDEEGSSSSSKGKKRVIEGSSDDDIDDEEEAPKSSGKSKANKTSEKSQPSSKSKSTKEKSPSKPKGKEKAKVVVSSDEDEDDEEPNSEDERFIVDDEDIDSDDEEAVVKEYSQASEAEEDDFICFLKTTSLIFHLCPSRLSLHNCTLTLGGRCTCFRTRPA